MNSKEWYDKAYSANSFEETLASWEWQTVQLVASDLKDKNMRILSLGCGRGKVLEELSKHGYNNLFGMDLSGVAIREASKRSYGSWLPKRFFQGDYLENRIPTKIKPGAEYFSYENAFNLNGRVVGFSGTLNSSNCSIIVFPVYQAMFSDLLTTLSPFNALTGIK